jgi:hypothetical protein
MGIGSLDRSSDRPHLQRDDAEGAHQGGMDPLASALGIAR